MKVSGGTPRHSYIIQNNNWGNAAGTEQTITYKDNSFKITAETGGDIGGGSAIRTAPSAPAVEQGTVGQSGAAQTIAPAPKTAKKTAKKKGSSAQ